MFAHPAVCEIGERRASASHAMVRRRALMADRVVPGRMAAENLARATASSLARGDALSRHDERPRRRARRHAHGEARAGAGEATPPILSYRGVLR
jgi:hypothetical protein